MAAFKNDVMGKKKKKKRCDGEADSTIRNLIPLMEKPTLVDLAV